MCVSNYISNWKLLRCFVLSFASWQVLGAINWSCQETNFVTCFNMFKKQFSSWIRAEGHADIESKWIQEHKHLALVSCFCWDWYELKLAATKQNTFLKLHCDTHVKCCSSHIFLKVPVTCNLHANSDFQPSLWCIWIVYSEFALRLQCHLDKIFHVSTANSLIFSVWSTVLFWFFSPLLLCMKLGSLFFHSPSLTRITLVICGWDWGPLVVLIII